MVPNKKIAFQWVFNVGEEFAIVTHCICDRNFWKVMVDFFRLYDMGFLQRKSTRISSTKTNDIEIQHKNEIELLFVTQAQDI